MERRIIPLLLAACLGSWALCSAQQSAAPSNAAAPSMAATIEAPIIPVECQIPAFPPALALPKSEMPGVPYVSESDPEFNIILGPPLDVNGSAKPGRPSLEPPPPFLPDTVEAPPFEHQAGS